MELIIALISAAAAVLGTLIVVMNERNRAKLEDLRGLLDGAYTTQFKDTNVFILGPRTSGKTSVIERWTRIWSDIEDMPPTPVEFIEKHFKFPEYGETEYFDHRRGVRLRQRTHARAIIYDYAGEDSALPKAIERMTRTPNFIVVFVLTCEPFKERLNDEYYNTNFLRRTQRALGRGEPAQACFVLFNKFDLMEGRPTSNSDDDAREFCLQKFENAVHSITSAFGQPYAFAISAQTGFGVAPFLQKMTSFFVGENGQPL